MGKFFFLLIISTTRLDPHNLEQDQGFRWDRNNDLDNLATKHES